MYYIIWYQERPKLDYVLGVQGFVVVEWVRDLDHRRATSSNVFSLFVGEISYINKKRDID